MFLLHVLLERLLAVVEEDVLAAKDVRVVDGKCVLLEETFEFLDGPLLLRRFFVTGLHLVMVSTTG